MKQPMSAEDLGKEKAEKLFNEWKASTGDAGKAKVIPTSQTDRHNFIRIIGEVLARYINLNRDQIDAIKRQCGEIEKVNRILRGGRDFVIAVPHLYLEQVLNDLDGLMDWLDKFHHDPDNDHIIFKVREATEKLVRRFPERAWSGALYRCPKCLSRADTHDITLERIGYTCHKCHTIFYVERGESKLEP